MICNQCGKTPGWPTNTEKAMDLCIDCASKTPGEAKACPSCGCPLVERRETWIDEGGPRGEWSWHVAVLDGYDGLITRSPLPIHYCPEHGCDLEAEFHLALKAKRVKR